MYLTIEHQRITVVFFEELLYASVKLGFQITTRQVSKHFTFYIKSIFNHINSYSKQLWSLLEITLYSYGKTYSCNYICDFIVKNIFYYVLFIYRCPFICLINRKLLKESLLKKILMKKYNKTILLF